jgi:hypothetical protein
MLEGLPLYGAELVRGWQARLRDYPEPLRRAMVERHWSFFPVWYYGDLLAGRDAELWRLDVLLEAAFNLLAVLAGVNRLYFTRSELKRMRALIGKMEVAPPQLGDRLESLFRIPPGEAAAELGRLVEETRALVTGEFPDLELSLQFPPGRRRRLGACPEQLFEPFAQPLDVGAAAGVELTAVAHVETGPADDVGHERVAGDDAATGQGGCKGTDVEAVARPASPLGEVAFEDRLDTPPAEALRRATLARERHAGREAAQQREQRQVRPCGRFDPMRLRLRDRDRPAGDGGPQHRLELAEAGLPLDDSAQVVLVEVDRERRHRRRCYAPSALAARS